MARASSSELPATVSSFPPLAAPDARILILGSMPSVASLQAQRYYAHPHNQFWPILGQILGFSPSLDYAVRYQRVCEAGIAIWDVLQSCVRPGSLDADIDPSSIVPNDFASFLAAHPQITLVCFNGGTAETLFRRHIMQRLENADRLSFVRLPSTSPAHAGMRPAAKLEAWRAALAATLQSQP